MRLQSDVSATQNRMRLRVGQCSRIKGIKEVCVCKAENRATKQSREDAYSRLSPEVCKPSCQLI